MNYEVAYQINTTGSSEGLPIPSGFAIAVLYSVQKALNSGESDPFILEIQVETYITPAFNDVININDDLIAQGFGETGNYKTYGLVTGDLDSAVRTLIKNNIRPDLDAAYGAGNVVEL